jgi:hypothetical protein
MNRPHLLISRPLLSDTQASFETCAYRLCTSIYVCMYIYVLHRVSGPQMCVCVMRVCAYIHTHTHTHTHSLTHTHKSVGRTYATPCSGLANFNRPLLPYIRRSFLTLTHISGLRCRGQSVATRRPKRWRVCGPVRCQCLVLGLRVRSGVCGWRRLCRPRLPAFAK